MPEKSEKCENPKNLKLGEVLRDLLDRNDMTVVELARKANVPKNTIFNWLNGVKPKDCEQLGRVAAIFNVSIDHLLFGSKNQCSLNCKQLAEELNAGIYEVVLRKVQTTK